MYHHSKQIIQDFILQRGKDEYSTNRVKVGGPWTASLEILSKRRSPVENRFTKQQTEEIPFQPTEIGRGHHGV